MPRARDSKGRYIKGGGDGGDSAPREKKERNIGTKRQVFDGTAWRTPGGLRRGDLTKNKRGKIVSAKASAAAKARFTPSVREKLIAGLQR